LLLLDTHAFIWWRSAPEKLSRDQSRRIGKQLTSGVPLSLSAISLWELALLGSKGRITVPTSLPVWLEVVERDPRLFFYPITSQIAADAAQLPDPFPRDPADRIIAATARCETLELVTADERIRDSGLVSVV